MEFTPKALFSLSFCHYRAFSHRENPTFKIWQRMRFVVVFRSYGKGHKQI
jgi:hypothetical protein